MQQLKARLQHPKEEQPRDPTGFPANMEHWQHSLPHILSDNKELRAREFWQKAKITTNHNEKDASMCAAVWQINYQCHTQLQIKTE